MGKNVWVGSNATILQGVTIGDGAVIGANALVTKDVPPKTVAAGIPAKIVKSIE
jgi:acetyltransferase-like isoleucine patch superfamily enzyme